MSESDDSTARILTISLPIVAILTTGAYSSYAHASLYADVYFEYLATSSLGIDEQIIKSATEGVSMGAGVRVIAGERTGHAYSDNLLPVKIRKAAHTAAHTAALIAKGPASVAEM